MTNRILLHDNHMEHCFCEICVAHKLSQMDNSIPIIRNHIEQMQLRREVHLGRMFNITKQQILYGKRYKDVCLHISNNPRHYTQFRSWAAKQPFYQRFVRGNEVLQREFKQHCQFVNDAALCVEKWSNIRTNLTDQRITHIDVRTLSVHNLARASSMNWCIWYNAQCGGTTNRPDPDEDGTYSAEDTERIFELILDDGVLDTINYDPIRATSLMKTTTFKVIRFCRAITE